MSSAVFELTELLKGSSRLIKTDCLIIKKKNHTNDTKTTLLLPQWLVLVWFTGRKREGGLSIGGIHITKYNVLGGTSLGVVSVCMMSRSSLPPSPFQQGCNFHFFFFCKLSKGKEKQLVSCCLERGDVCFLIVSIG